MELIEYMLISDSLHEIELDENKIKQILRAIQDVQRTLNADLWRD